MNVPPGLQNNQDWRDPTGQNYDPLSGLDPNSFTGGQDTYQPETGYNMGVGQGGFSDNSLTGGDFGVDQNPFNDSGFGQQLPQTADWGGQDQTFGNMGGGTDTEWGNISYDPSANAVDPGWGQTYDQPAPTNWGDGADQYSGGGGGGGGYSEPVAYDAGSGSGDFYGYSAGGAIDPNMSPSGGQQVDDVPAQGPPGQPNIRLNANEFVIPDDVAKWKGQEFFQNLITQSRKKRMTAPAHGQQQPQG